MNEAVRNDKKQRMTEICVYLVSELIPKKVVGASSAFPALQSRRRSHSISRKEKTPCEQRSAAQYAKGCFSPYVVPRRFAAHRRFCLV